MVHHAGQLWAAALDEPREAEAAARRACWCERDALPAHQPVAVRAQRDVLGRPTPEVLGTVRVGLARRRTSLAVDQRASAVAPHRHARDTVDRLIAAGRMSDVAVVADCSRLLAGRRSAGHRGVEVVVLTGSQYACQYSFTRTMYMAMMVRDIMPFVEGKLAEKCRVLLTGCGNPSRAKRGARCFLWRVGCPDRPASRPPQPGRIARARRRPAAEPSGR